MCLVNTLYTKSKWNLQITHRFDAFMKDRLVNEIEFAKLSNEFDVAQHFDLGDGTLLLLLRGEWAVIFIKD